MLSCHYREVSIGFMFDPLKKIAHEQILGSECYLAGHSEAFREKVQKSCYCINNNLNYSSYKS